MGVAGYPEMTNMAYLASSGLCIGAIGCLSNQKTARIGNALGLMGVGGGVAATLGAIGGDAALYGQIAGNIMGDAALYGQIAGDIGGDAALYGQIAGDIGVDAAMYGQITGTARHISAGRPCPDSGIVVLANGD